MVGQLVDVRMDIGPGPEQALFPCGGQVSGSEEANAVAFSDYDKCDAAPAASGGAPSKEVRCKGQVTASILNVRSWAGLEHPNIKTIPTLKYGTTVEICDTVKDAGGADWYYVLIDGRIYGFVSADYIRKI